MPTAADGMAAAHEVAAVRDSHWPRSWLPEGASAWVMGAARETTRSRATRGKRYRYRLVAPAMPSKHPNIPWVCTLTH